MEEAEARLVGIGGTAQVAHETTRSSLHGDGIGSGEGSDGNHEDGPTRIHLKVPMLSKRGRWQQT